MKSTSSTKRNHATPNPKEYKHEGTSCIEIVLFSRPEDPPYSIKSQPEAKVNPNSSTQPHMFTEFEVSRTALVRHAVLGFGPAAEFDGDQPLNLATRASLGCSG